MADLFDDFVSKPTGPSGPAGASDGLFEDFASVPSGAPQAPTEGGPRSVLAASARAGVQRLGSVAAEAVQAIPQQALSVGLPGTPYQISLDKANLLRIYKGDPAGFDRAWNSPMYYFQRLSDEMAARADATMANVNERGQRILDQTYVPWKDKPFVGLERMAADIAQGLPSTIALAGTVAASRGGAGRGALAGAAEGLLEGQGNYQEIRKELDARPLAGWQSDARYQALVKDGWHPENARRKLVEDLAREGARATALVAGAAGAAGGAVLGATGGNVVRRAATGAVSEIPVEAVQSGASEVIKNVQTGKPWTEGLDEAIAGGVVVGGVQGAAFNAALGRRKAAIEQTVVADTLGMPPDVAAVKPLPAVAATIGEAAKLAGVDPAVAIAVASIETGGTFNPSLVNSIGATGLFQFLGPAMQQYGVTREQLLADPAVQIAAGVKMLSDAHKAVARATGREPLPGEIYMAQLFGHGGVQKILTAPDDTKLIDVVRAYGGPDATLTGNGMSLDITVGQAKERFAGFMATHMGRESAVPGRAIDPAIDKYRSRAARSLDEDDLGMLSDAQMAVDQAEVEAVERRRPLGGADNVETLDRVREPSLAQTNNQEVMRPMPPADLLSGTLRYENILVRFVDPMMQALYAVTDTGSPQYGTWLRWLENTEGGNLRVETINELAPQVLAIVKKAADLHTAERSVSDLLIPESDIRFADPLGTPISDPLSLLDTGMSEDERSTRQAEANPNHRIKRESRPVQYGPADAIGKPIREARLRPGEVATIGMPWAGATLEYMGAVHDMVQKFIAEFAPTARVILGYETRGEGVAFMRDLGNGWYHINPRNLHRFQEIGQALYNKTTQAKAAYSLAHEIGHVIVAQEFMRGLAPSQVLAIETLPKMEYFSEEFLTGLPADQQTILREYNEVKRSLLENPKATAKDFILKWLSPWKISHGFDQAQKPEDGWKRFADTPGRGTSSRMNARQFAEGLSNTHPGILGVHEYLAEQFARYAQNKRLVEQTALGQTTWFAQALAKLQLFFRKAKLEKLVAPMESFSKWLSKLPDVAPKPSTRARRQAVPVNELSSDSDGSTRFDDADSIALRDQILFNERLGAAKLPDGLEFQVDERTPGQLSFNIAEPGGPVHYFMDVQLGGAQPGKVLNVKNVTRKHSGLGEALYDFASGEMQARGVELRSGDTTSTFAERIWQKREAAGKARQDGRLWKSVPDAARAEALELLAHGQPETAKEVIEQALGRPRILRWDGDVPGFDAADSIIGQVDRVPGARAATRGFMPGGMRRLIELGHGLLDLRQMAASKPHILGLRMINTTLTNKEAFQGTLETKSTEVAQRWAKLSKVQSGRLSAMMEAESAEGRHLVPLKLDAQNRIQHVPDTDFAKRMLALGIEPSTAQVFVDVKNDYLTRLRLLQKYMRDRLLAAREADPDRAAYWNARMQQLAQKFDLIRATPFHPQTRFGNYFVEVRRAGQSQPFHVESFESAVERDAARDKIEKYGRSKGERWAVSGTYLDSHAAVLRVLPASVLGQFGLGGTLTAKQNRQLASTLDLVARDGVLKKYSPDLGRITGASRLHHRVYADFMHHDALLLSKMAYRQDLTDGLNEIKQVIIEASQARDTKVQQDLESVLKFANKAVKQILNPAQEFHAVRSFVVAHDLWFNIKSAVANVTDLVKTWARVTKLLGDISGNRVLGKVAAKVAADRLVLGMQKVLRAPADGWAAAYTPEEARVLQSAISEGLLDETAAAQMAGWANAGTLERMGMPSGRRVVDTLMRWGMTPLRVVEQFTRRVTFLTLYNAYRESGLSEAVAYANAKEEVHLINQDNSITNRAEIVRGKKSIAFIYFNFMRSTMWLMSGHYSKSRRAKEASGELPPSRGIVNETGRMWLAYFALGGLMGLPGAEDLDELVELFAKQLGYRLSPKELAYELARDVATGANDLGIPISPRTVMHGFASGVPLPGGGSVDISPSVGLGHAVPGLGGVDKLGGKAEDEFLTGLAGPLGRRIQEAMNLFKGDLPPERRWALFIPASVANGYKGIDLAFGNEPRFHSGGRILVDPRTGEVKDLTTMEVLAQGMGFAPADVAARRELHYMQKEFAEYWMGRRNGLIAQVWEARLQKNQDAIHDAMKAVRRFNEDAPAAGLRITGETLSRSMAQRQKAARRDEAGLPRVEGLRPGYRAIQESVLGR